MPPWARPCGAFEEKAPLWLSADKDKAEEGQARWKKEEDGRRRKEDGGDG